MQAQAPPGRYIRRANGSAGPPSRELRTAYLVPGNTHDNTHPGAILKAVFLDKGEGVLNTPSDASMQPSRRNLSKATIFVMCAPP